jgi:hypothetical protein
LNIFASQLAVSVATCTVVAKNKDATSERLRVNVVRESNGKLRAVDKSLVVNVGNVLPIWESNAGKHVAPDVALDAVKVFDLHLLDCGDEWVY